MNQKLFKIILINLLVHYIMKIKIEFFKMLLSKWSWYMHVFILKMLHFIWQFNQFSKSISIFLNILHQHYLYLLNSPKFKKAINQNKCCVYYITNKGHWQIKSAINFFVIRATPKIYFQNITGNWFLRRCLKIIMRYLM